MGKRTDVRSQEGWVIITEDGDAIHFVTWEDVLGASQYIDGHVMSERHYEQRQREKEDESNS